MSLERMIRLNKYLASAGIASRRKCDDLIMAGKVRVNGEIITQLGVRIDETRDLVEFEDRPIKPTEQRVYILLNKPVEVVTTVADEHNRPTVIELVNYNTRIFPVGRLDYRSTGALLLTNDGELSNLLIHPRYKVKKVYNVLLDKRIRPIDLYHFEHGIMLDGKMTMPCKAREIRIVDNCSFLEIEMREGRNRQIRRMMRDLGYEVEELDRISFANLSITGLQRGQWRLLTEEELKHLKAEVSNGVER